LKRKKSYLQTKHRTTLNTSHNGEKGRKRKASREGAAILCLVPVRREQDNGAKKEEKRRKNERTGKKKAVRNWSRIFLNTDPRALRSREKTLVGLVREGRGPGRVRVRTPRAKGIPPPAPGVGHHIENSRMSSQHCECGKTQGETRQQRRQDS